MFKKLKQLLIKWLRPCIREKSDWTLLVASLSVAISLIKLFLGD